jgi:hypothetical protein
VLCFSLLIKVLAIWQGAKLCYEDSPKIVCSYGDYLINLCFYNAHLSTIILNRKQMLKGTKMIVVNTRPTIVGRFGDDLTNSLVLYTSQQVRLIPAVFFPAFSEPN